MTSDQFSTPVAGISELCSLSSRNLRCRRCTSHFSGHAAHKNKEGIVALVAFIKLFIQLTVKVY